VTDDELDGGATGQLALDDTKDVALLAGDEDATGVCLKGAPEKPAP